MGQRCVLSGGRCGGGGTVVVVVAAAAVVAVALAVVVESPGKILSILMFFEKE